MSERLVFGARKYIAFSMMVARWLSYRPSIVDPVCYVTMGGTEMFDALALAWVNERLVSSVVSYEQDRNRFRLALATAESIRKLGIDVEVRQDDYFTYRRHTAGTNIYYVDLLGTLGNAQYYDVFRNWFVDEVILPGDLILITSYLGRNKGWERVLRAYEQEFRFLKVSGLAERKEMYAAVYPGFVLRRGLQALGLDRELRLDCLGHIRYRDTSPMGLYGFVCEEGVTDLATMVCNVRQFNCNSVGAGVAPERLVSARRPEHSDE